MHQKSLFIHDNGSLVTIDLNEKLYQKTAKYAIENPHTSGQAAADCAWFAQLSTFSAHAKNANEVRVGCPLRYKREMISNFVAIFI